MTEHLEGRQSVLAALSARQRRFDVILIAHGAHLDKLADLIELAANLGVPIKYVDRRELDDLAHGQTHGGVIALVGPKPRATADQLIEIVPLQLLAYYLSICNNANPDYPRNLAKSVTVK